MTKNSESSTLNPESKGWNPESNTVLAFLIWAKRFIHGFMSPISQQRFGVWFIRSFGFTHQYFDLCSRSVVEAWLEKWAPVMLNFLRDNKAEFRAFTFFLLQGMIGDPGRRGSDGPQGPKVRL